MKTVDFSPKKIGFLAISLYFRISANENDKTDAGPIFPVIIDRFEFSEAQNARNRY